MSSAATREPTFLVLGATGKTGRRVLARLRLRDQSVRAASRTGSTPFDWSDRSTWDAALAGVDRVYVVPPASTEPMPEFVQRAAAAGVAHLVLLSGHGADRWGDITFGRDMLAAERAVRRSGVPWTIVRSSNFAQNFDEELWHEPLLDGELALPAGAVGEPFIDLEDVADVLTEVLLRPERHVDRIHEITGPRSIAFAEAVTLISRASGLPVEYRQVSADAYRRDLVGRGLGSAAADVVTDMFVMMADGVIADVADGVRDVLGRAPHTFEDYVVRTAVTGAWRPTR